MIMAIHRKNKYDISKNTRLTLNGITNYTEEIQHEKKRIKRCLYNIFQLLFFPIIPFIFLSFYQNIFLNLFCLAFMIISCLDEFRDLYLFVNRYIENKNNKKEILKAYIGNSVEYLLYKKRQLARLQKCRKNKWK